MGAKERTLEQLLSGYGEVGARTLTRPSFIDVSTSRYADTVMGIYRALGGGLDAFPLNLRAWDIEFDGLAVELDEQLHFNRFRAATLKSSVYAELPAFPLAAYQTYCSDREDACIRAGRHGGKWTSNSSEKQFGPSPPRGDFDGSGPARWRQRAFYDFVKDLAPLIIRVPVVRIAIWDKVEINGRFCTIEEILKHPSSDSASAIIDLINERRPYPRKLT